MLGTNFPYTKFLPGPGKVKVVQVDIAPERAGTRIPTDVPLVGDVGATLEALIPLLDRKDRAHLETYQEKTRDWREKMTALESADREPIAPQYLAAQLDQLARGDAILTCDSGTIATWAARHWQIRGEREFYLSGTLATMAPGLPYAIGIQHAHPDRQVIAYVGDGGFAMLMAEFHTAARYRLPIKVIINNNNNALGQILWEQMVLGYPEHGVRFGEPLPDYAGWARGCGGYSVQVSKPGDLPSALQEAFAHPGPALVDVAVDPDEPPLPGKVSYEQAKKFATAWLRGQPHKAAIATTLFKDKIEQLRG
jgi:pyruvate dehydrogenase (quinone)/pyruvate oxidase